MKTYPILDLQATGRQIKKIRIEKHISIADICEYMGFENPQAVYKWQRGETLPSVDNLFALSRLLETSIENILCEREEATASFFCVIELSFLNFQFNDISLCICYNHTRKVNNKLIVKERTTMENKVKMLVTQALDERDLLVKKINDKIQTAVLADVVKNNEDNVYNRRISREEFRKEAESAYQQIMDLIERYNRLEAAIVESNANTYIETSYGKYSVAAAITLRNRMRGDVRFAGVGDFESTLLIKLKKSYHDCIDTMERKNRSLSETAEEMRLSILGRETKSKDDKPLEVVETYIKENTMKMADPLDIVKKMERLQERKDRLLSELETQIKVSNATTFISI